MSISFFFHAGKLLKTHPPLRPTTSTTHPSEPKYKCFRLLSARHYHLVLPVTCNVNKMVYIYNKLSLNEDSPPPNSQRLPSGAGTYTRISSTNQTPKRMGRRQFQQSSPGFSMAAMSFVAHFQPPHQFPPVTCAPPFPPSVSLASAQGPPGDYAYRQEPASMYKPHQPPLVDMPFQPLPPTRFGFPQGLPQQQTMAPPVEFMVSELLVQFVINYLINMCIFFNI